MTKQINFDMDGTIADFYGVEGWLDYLMAGDIYPYQTAKPLVNMSALARQLHRLQRCGYEINIISWTSRGGSEFFNRRVELAKKCWLMHHMPSVYFDHIHIIPYGTPKENFGEGILFDDEQHNRENWCGVAYDVQNILEILRELK